MYHGRSLGLAAGPGPMPYEFASLSKMKFAALLGSIGPQCKGEISLAIRFLNKQS